MGRWLRWKVARILDRWTPWCWADLATWTMEDREPERLADVRDGSACELAAERDGSCYCGKYLQEADDG